MEEATTDRYVSQLLTNGRHHNISGTFMVYHNLFPHEKHARTLALNCTTFILMRSPRLEVQVQANELTLCDVKFHSFIHSFIGCDIGLPVEM